MSEQECFLVKGCNFAPDHYIKLGQVIADPESPEIALCTLNPLEVESSTQDDWELQTQETKLRSGGIWAMIPAIFPIGGGISANAGIVNSSHWHFKTLETRHFVPQDDYIKQSMNLPNVKKYFQQHAGKPVYMITAVRIAQNATVKHETTIGRGGNISASVDASGAGNPLTAGTNASSNSEETSSGSYNKPGAFVFAYQLLKISKNSTTGVLTRKKHTDGATKMYAADEDGESLSTFPAKQDVLPRFQDLTNGESKENTRSKSTRGRNRKIVVRPKPMITCELPRMTHSQAKPRPTSIMESCGSNLLK